MIQELLPKQKLYSTGTKNRTRSMSNGGSEHTAGPVYLGKTDSKRPTPAVSSVSCEFLVLLEDDIVHAAAFRNAGVLDDRCFYAVLRPARSHSP